MIAIKLKDGMEAYKRRTGVRLTYADVAQMSGLSAATVEAIGSKLGYNATLETVEKLCIALGTTPDKLLELIGDPHSKGIATKARKKNRKKKG